MSMPRVVFRAGLPEDLAAFALARMGEAVRAVVAELQSRPTTSGAT